VIVAATTLVLATAAYAEPTTCSEAYRICVKPQFGHCDRGCIATCRMRLEGCLKTGSFSTQSMLLKGLRRR
jgi:hypothetical protein